MLTRRTLGKQAAAGAAAALGMVGAAEAAMATSGQVSGVSRGLKGQPELAQAVYVQLDGVPYRLLVIA